MLKIYYWWPLDEEGSNIRGAQLGIRQLRVSDQGESSGLSLPQRVEGGTSGDVTQSWGQMY
jgi:hypothetical protein